MMWITRFSPILVVSLCLRPRCDIRVMSIVAGGKGSEAHPVGVTVKMDTISRALVGVRSTFTQQRGSVAESSVGTEEIH